VDHTLQVLHPTNATWKLAHHYALTLKVHVESARPVTSLSNATAKLRNQQQRTTIERLELEIFMHLRHSLAIINHINLISKSSQRQTPMMICVQYLIALLFSVKYVLFLVIR